MFPIVAVTAAKLVVKKKKKKIKNTEIILLQFWKTQIQNKSYGAKFSVSKVNSFRRLQERIYYLPFPAAGGSWRSLANGHIIPISLLLSFHCLLFCSQIFLCLPLVRTLGITFRAYLDKLG